MWIMIDGLDCGSTLRKLQASHTESKTQPVAYTIISGGPFISCYYMDQKSFCLLLYTYANTSGREQFSAMRATQPQDFATAAATRLVVNLSRSRLSTAYFDMKVAYNPPDQYLVISAEHNRKYQNLWSPVDIVCLELKKSPPYSVEVAASQLRARALTFMGFVSKRCKT